MRTLKAAALVGMATCVSAVFMPMLILLKVVEGLYEGVAIWWSCCRSAWLGR